MIEVIFALLMFAVLLANAYIFKFQRSSEGNDERGKLIQLKTINSTYNALFIGSVVLIVLNLVDILTAQQAIDFLLYFLVFNSIYGAFSLYRNKNKPI